MYEAPEVSPIGELDGVPYYDDDCSGEDNAAAVIVSGVRLCPDAQVLAADWPTYPEHSWSGAAAAGDPSIDLTAYAARFNADAGAADISGYAWMLLDATAPRDEMVLASGSGGLARTSADDSDAPAAGAPMQTDTFGLIGSVSKLVSSFFFIRMLEDIAIDPARNPSGLTTPQLLELPAYHFLPRDWKGCIGNAACGISLYDGEDADSANDTFKQVRLRELIDHTSGLGVSGKDYGTERLWGYMVSGTELYNVSGDDNTNNVSGVYDYENVNVRFLAALFDGLSSPARRAERTRTTVCDDGSGSGNVPEKQEDFEDWSLSTLDDMIVEMHEVIRDIRTDTGSAFTYSCDVPGGRDIDDAALPGVAYVYTGGTGGELDAGAWFSYGGCPPQGSFWTSTEMLAELLWEAHSGDLFRDDRVLGMLTAYGSPDERMIFGHPLSSPYLGEHLEYNSGDVHWKGGDQPVTSRWQHAATGELLGAGDYTLKSGHAAVVVLPYGQYAVSIVNSGGFNSVAQATALKNAWVDALYAGSTLFPEP